MKQFVFLLILHSLLVSGVVEADLKVVASIKPLVLILKEIGGDHIQIKQLIPDQASHHDYPLKMSNYKVLQSADLVVWVGPELESFLVRPLANLQPENVFSLISVETLHWPRTNEADDHDHTGRDPHFWLNPQNVILVVKALTKTLSDKDSENSRQYQVRANQFIESLQLLDQKLEKNLMPLRESGFVVYHHGYNHFVERYQLKQLGYLTITPEKKKGAKHLNALMKVLENEGQCIYKEPFENDSQLSRIAKEYKLEIGNLDLMGINSNSYLQLMESLSESFSACLLNRSSQGKLRR